jgi:hypothetical protein
VIQAFLASSPTKLTLTFVSFPFPFPFPFRSLSAPLLFHSAFSLSPSTDGPSRHYEDHPQCLGWIREGDADHDPSATVVCNGTEQGEKRMQVPGGDEHKGEVWTDILGWSQEEVTIEEDGTSCFPISHSFYDDDETDDMELTTICDAYRMGDVQGAVEECVYLDEEGRSWSRDVLSV